MLHNNFHLSYCTNIHPASGWDSVFETLKQYAPAVKTAVSPDAPFGIGLRISGDESHELLAGDHLPQFKQWLDDNNLYVFTINGFPYGAFHRERVKEDVHTPDWRTQERVDYTVRLVDILAALLPDFEREGSISTSPLSYAKWIDRSDDATWQLLTRNVITVVQRMMAVRAESDMLIHMDLEPEPDGLLQSSTDLVTYFEDWLLKYGAEYLAQENGISEDEARAALLEYVRVCFDTCHVALMYEDPAEVLARYDALGIKVGKVQISSALRVPLPEDAAKRTEIAAALERFSESTYLHQVIEQDAQGELVQYEDLPDALPHIATSEADEWRIHFHVPIQIEEYATFYATQDGILKTFDLLKERPFTRHLEVETYTWEVLPDDIKVGLQESIERELKWVLDVFN
ncbi:MAG: metabolite traffic protein EboE [Chloroflexota bacterium]